VPPPYKEFRLRLHKRRDDALRAALGQTGVTVFSQQIRAVTGRLRAGDLQVGFFFFFFLNARDAAAGVGFRGGVTPRSAIFISGVARLNSRPTSSPAIHARDVHPDRWRGSRTTFAFGECPPLPPARGAQGRPPNRSEDRWKQVCFCLAHDRPTATRPGSMACRSGRRGRESPLLGQADAMMLVSSSGSHRVAWTWGRPDPHHTPESRLARSPRHGARHRPG